MAIQTQDCVFAIIFYFLEKDVEKGSPLLDKTQWKRLSKSGTGDYIKRMFENKKTGKKVEVTSSEIRILNVYEDVIEKEKSDLKYISKFNKFSDSSKELSSILQQVFSTPDFDRCIDENKKDESLWECEKVDELMSLENAQDDYDYFVKDCKSWGGWVSDKFQSKMNSSKLTLEEYLLIGTDFTIIETVSLNGELLMWFLHED